MYEKRTTSKIFILNFTGIIFTRGPPVHTLIGSHTTDASETGGPVGLFANPMHFTAHDHDGASR